MPVFIPSRRPAEFKSKDMPENIIFEKQIRDTLMKAAVGKDCLRKDELTKAFKDFGSRMPAWRACHCLRKADTDHDGQISWGDELDIVVDYVLAWYKIKK